MDACQRLQRRNAAGSTEGNGVRVWGVFVPGHGARREAVIVGGATTDHR